MRVLIACEWSGRVRDAFRQMGHDAYSCDIVAGIGNPHIRRDVREILNDEWDMMVAFPPCTYLANAGNSYKILTARQVAEKEAIVFVDELWNAPIPRIAIENPVGALSTKWRKPSQYIQPYWFGDPYKKKTCLWLKNLPLLVQDRTYRRGDINLWVAPNRGESQKKMRELTFKGVARAMAEQWGEREANG